jgi:nitrogen fixation protein NifU and related proteins
MQAAEKDDELLSLYQEIILDHGKSPRNIGTVEHCDCRSEGKNPLCGDRVTITAALDEAGIVSDLRFDGKGCAISIASASMMTEAVKGLVVDEAKQVFAAVRALCTEEVSPEAVMERLGDNLRPRLKRLVALSGVRQFPVRVKCATLPWHTMMACFEGKSLVSTER